MQERPLYASDHLVITPTRIIGDGTIYTLANITGLTQGQFSPAVDYSVSNGIMKLIAIVCFVVGGIGQYFEHGGLGYGLAFLLLMILGLSVIRPLRKEEEQAAQLMYTVTLHTIGGENVVLYSQDPEDAQEIHTAVNQAIMLRG